MLIRLVVIFLVAFVTGGKDTDSSMWDAAKNGDVSRLEALIKQGVDVNALDEDGDTPLMVASYYGQLQIVKVLLDAGAKVNISHKYGGTALISAAVRGHLQIVKALIEKRADINAKTYDGRTSLMLAAQTTDNNSIDIISALLRGKADINAKDDYGFTALMYALNSPPPPPMPPPDSKAESYAEFEKSQARAEMQKEVIKALLAGGADVHAQARDGNTALIIAQHYGQKEIIRMLKQAGAEK